MAEEKKQLTVFYHAHCLDGSASAWMASKWAEKKFDEVVYIPLNHDGDEETLRKVKASAPPDTSLLFVDYTPTPSVLEELTHHASSITIQDHHGTDIADMETYLKQKGITLQDQITLCSINECPIIITLDSLHSGAQLARDTFTRLGTRSERDMPIISDSESALVDLIAMVDMGKFGTDPQERENNLCISAILDTRPDVDIEAITQFFERMAKMSIPELIEAGKERHVENNKMLERALAERKYVQLVLEPNTNPVFVPAVKLIGPPKQYGRELDEKLRLMAQEEGGDCHLAFCYWEDGDKIRLGLRSNGCLNAGDVAKILVTNMNGIEGGGHPDIAGAQFKKNIFEEAFHFVSKEEKGTIQGQPHVMESPRAHRVDSHSQSHVAGL